MTSSFTESVVEEAALAWLESLGWTVKYGPQIDEALRIIARELVETVRRNVTIDWTLRANVRAGDWTESQAEQW